MTTQSKYEATDDDLPDLFFGKHVKQGTVTLPSEKEIQVALHYPSVEWRSPKRIRHEEREARKAEKAGDPNRKQFIKSDKKRQMNSWLEALDEQRPVMNPWEIGFVIRLLEKFRKYYPEVKWITIKQYEALKHIAVSCLKLPKPGNGPENKS